VFSWRRFGLSDREIADRLGERYDTLRRKDVFRRADQHQDEWRGRWERLPLIVAVEREQRPSLLETWLDPRLWELSPPAVKRQRERVVALTKDGPRPHFRRTEPSSSTSLIG